METHDIVAANVVQAGEPAGYEGNSSPGALAPILQRRWKTLFFVTAILGTLSGLTIWLSVEPQYEVSAIVHVAPVVRPILFADADTDISRQYRPYVATESRAIVSNSVIFGALNMAEVRSLKSVASTPNPEVEIAERLNVEHVGGTYNLKVSMIGEDPEDMAVIINSVLESYLRQRGDKKREWDQKILSSLWKEQSELQARLEGKSVELRQLAAENGTEGVVGSGTGIDAWAIELNQRLTQARQASALAAAKLAAIAGFNGADDPAELELGVYESYQKDPEWQSTREQLKALESAALDDERLGRGPEHPEVKGRSNRIEMFQRALEKRESELQDFHKDLIRRRLEAERFDADITARVLQVALDEHRRQRSDVARHVFTIEDLRHERDRLENSMAQVRQKIWNVEIEQNRMARVTIDSPAVVPKAPNIDLRLKYSAVACAMSFFLGVGAALMRHRLDTSVREPVDITRHLGMSLLGSVQYVPDTNGAGPVNDDRVLEPIRGISTALLASPRTERGRSRLITSPTARSGKSSLSLSLARSLASTGRRVLLVDADNRGQGVTQASEMAGRPGLREFLEGAHGPEAAVQKSGVENLEIMPAGTHHERFGEILGWQQTQTKLRSLFKTYDEVIVDSPPVLAGSDAVVLATLVDEVVLVLRAGRSTREEAKAACEYLATVGVKPVGVILNAVDTRSAPYSYYGYAYAGGGETNSV